MIEKQEPGFYEVDVVAEMRQRGSGTRPLDSAKNIKVCLADGHIFQIKLTADNLGLRVRHTTVGWGREIAMTPEVSNSIVITTIEDPRKEPL